MSRSWESPADSGPCARWQGKKFFRFRDHLVAASKSPLTATTKFRGHETICGENFVNVLAREGINLSLRRVNGYPKTARRKPGSPLLRPSMALVSASLRFRCSIAWRISCLRSAILSSRKTRARRNTSPRMREAFVQIPFREQVQAHAALRAADASELRPG